MRRGATGGRGSSVVRRGGGRGSADEPRDEGALSVAAGEREFGFCFFVFSDFCDWSTFFVCSEKMAMFRCESFTLNGCFWFLMHFCKNISRGKKKNTSSSCAKSRMIIS